MRVLFVCTGNSCRSFMAQELLKKIVLDNKSENYIKVDSCGTGAQSAFRVHEEVKAILKEKGIEFSGYIPKKIYSEVVEKSDIILCMENYHLARVRSDFFDVSGKTSLIKEFAGLGHGEVADPMGKSFKFYRENADEINNCASLVYKKSAAEYQ